MLFPLNASNSHFSASLSLEDLAAPVPLRRRCRVDPWSVLNIHQLFKRVLLSYRD